MSNSRVCCGIVCFGEKNVQSFGRLQKVLPENGLIQATPQLTSRQSADLTYMTRFSLELPQSVQPQAI